MDNLVGVYDNIAADLFKTKKDNVAAGIDMDVYTTYKKIIYGGKEYFFLIGRELVNISKCYMPFFENYKIR